MLTADQIDALLAVPARDRFRTAVKWDGRRQNTLAALAGISPRQIGYLLEEGLKLPPYDVAIALARALGVPHAVLWGGATTATRPASRDVPGHWRHFAARHDLSVEVLLTQAVECYIDAAEAHEQGYRPWPVVQGAEPVAGVQAEPLTVIPASLFRRLLGVVEDTPASIGNDPRFLTYRQVAEIAQARLYGHPWALIAADYKVAPDTLRERYERSVVAYEARA